VLARIEAGDELRMIWISGPSREGLRFLMLNLDDYFWPVVEHPTDWLNDRNFETPEALDIQTINRHLKALLAGDTVEKPIYSFKEGTHVGTKPLRLEKDQLLLLDCLHGFYPPLTAGIPKEAMFRLYIEAANMLYEGDGCFGMSSTGATPPYKRCFTGITYEQGSYSPSSPSWVWQTT